jgi:error-prone DNA polymerase
MLREYQTLGLHPSGQIMAALRGELPGVCTTQEVRFLKEGSDVAVAGMIASRQRPGSANGYVFMAMLDEFSLLPIVVPPGIYERDRAEMRQPILLIRGQVSRRDGTFSIRADRGLALPISLDGPIPKEWG